MEAAKRDFLQLLDSDIEFRYAVAGYLGLSEILKRLDSITEELVNLRREQVRLRKGQNRIWKEIQGLREEQIKLREDFNKMLATINRMEGRLNRVERTLEKLTVDVEDEAKSILKWRIRNELGVELDLTSLILPDMELNIYGATNDLCVVGEATVRGGTEIAEELLRKIERLRLNHPEMLRRNLIKVIYVCLPLPGLIERGVKEGIWILKATEEFHRPELRII